MVIDAAIRHGVGCPYDPVVKVKIEQAEQECLDIWANNEPPQAAIDAGLMATLPDGTSVQPVITRDASDVPLMYLPEAATVTGGCSVHSEDGYFGAYAFYSGSFTDTYADAFFYINKCDDYAVDLTAPRVGQIVTSGACVEEETNTYHTAWVLFWGGRYGAGFSPVCAKISVSIISRKGRDGIADATQMLQMILDFIDRSYAADPSAASTVTTPPEIPVPSSTPS